VEVGQPETAADEAAVPEEPLDLAGGGIGGDVEILGGPFQQQVTDAPPDEIGDESFVSEPVEGPQGMGVDLLPGDIVLFPGDDPWRHDPLHSTIRGKRTTFLLMFWDKSVSPNGSPQPVDGSICPGRLSCMDIVGPYRASINLFTA